MNRILPFLALLLCIGTASAQNPFEKFGYTPKIGTLSKGKYIEHFDTDSIVQIGSVLFNPFTKKIIGFVQQQTVYSEATLQPEIVSRWLTPDPLSEEFPEWSPYTFTNNNPIFFTDPTGLAPQGLLDDYGLDQNGKIQLIKRTNDNTDTLFSVTADGSGNLVKNENGEIVRNDTKGDGNVRSGDSVTVNKGILNNIENTTIVNSDGTKNNLQIMNVSSGSSSEIKSLFEFSSNNSNSEFSFSKL